MIPTIQRITGRASDIGEGMTVLRALPTRQRRMIGAWCFLDHLGPVDFPAGHGMHVGAHPHIGLQTFTWLMEGEVLHRDSLGSEQIIRPGQVNLMTAGHGIVHTEDTLIEGQRLHAAQLWIALPPEAADCPPAFNHYPDLPRWDADAATLTLLAGTYAGHHMPAHFYTPLVGLDAHSPTGGELSLSLEPDFEHGLFVLEGEMQLAGETYALDDLAYVPPGPTELTLRVAPGSRLLLVGGEPFPEPILMFWNFVGHQKADIATAWRDWSASHPRFGRVDGDDGRRLTAPPLPWSGT
jgi:redox-sensitive bicupin YhaK (pirin superfamily)